MRSFVLYHAARAISIQFLTLCIVFQHGCSAEVPPHGADSSRLPPDSSGRNPESNAAPAKAIDTPIGNNPATRSDHEHTNRLAEETSPYLLMHAHNPVDWYPWGEEAFAKAKAENKLVFLSIGYSSCYWCHVMERESFMDEEIADFLNEHYVCIKVDREERPDVDSIYMSAVQIITRHGGWPMSVFLTPGAQPIFGGTYFPARDADRPGARGFLSIVRELQDKWTEDAAPLEESAKHLTQLVKRYLTSAPVLPVNLDQALLDQTLDELSSNFDQQHGGFYNPARPQAPKFPEPSNLVFLIDYVDRNNDGRARKMLVATLDAMAQGGIRDHLGGGFHRYSTDRFWHIPHFEKMLYDNGQLAAVYSAAYRLTKREDYRAVVVEMLDFILRELTGQQGGFYAALDAETDAEEGKYYRWDKSELQRLLTAAQWQEFAPLYSVYGEPNFEHKYFVPMLARPLKELDESQRNWRSEQFPEVRGKLWDARNKRKRPLTDTKILTGWNGLMIGGFADAGRLLDEPRFVEAAERAAHFVLEKLRTPDGRLLRTHAGGHAKLNAYLSDYAFLVDGLLALHAATGDEDWLKTADELTATQLDLFWDDQQGGFYFTSDDHEALIARAKNPIDGAQPSGNSVAAHNLVRLGLLLDKPENLEYAERTIQSSATLLRNSPVAVPRLAVAISALIDSRPNGGKDPESEESDP